MVSDKLLLSPCICRYNLTAFSEDSNGTVIGIIKAVDPDSADTGMVSNHGNCSVVGIGDQIWRLFC